MSDNRNDFYNRLEVDNMENKNNITYETFKDSHGRQKIRGDWTHDGVTKQITFAANYGNHTWSDDEIQSLLKDEQVTIKDFESKSGKISDITGKLDTQTYMGKSYIGFARVEPEKTVRRLPDVPSSENENQMEKE